MPETNRRAMVVDARLPLLLWWRLRMLGTSADARGLWKQAQSFEEGYALTWIATDLYFLH